MTLIHSDKQLRLHRRTIYLKLEITIQSHSTHGKQDTTLLSVGQEHNSV